MNKIALAIHGGAGTLVKGMMTPELEKVYKEDLNTALQEGYIILAKGGSSIDAVERSVNCLEDSPLFNAGKGSVFTATGDHEMDASIMDGKSRNAGAISLVSGIRNPISLARDVMAASMYFAGEGAIEFAKNQLYF